MAWPKVRHKYGAVACERDGKKFPSKLERRVYDYLKQLKKDGKIRFFLMQTRLDLPANVKHMVDFTVFTPEHVVFLEAKGRDLPQGRNKRLISMEIYNIDIHVCKNLQDVDEALKGEIQT